MGMTTALNIGLTALTAHQRALEVTSHNIANAATPGYSRQRAQLGTQVPANGEVGQMGRGTVVQSIDRLHDSLLDARLQAASAEVGRLDYLQRSLADAELLFNEPGENGFQARINQLFSTFEDLSGNPESTALRAGATQELTAFAESLNFLANGIDEQQTSLFTAANDLAANATSILAQLNDLNELIRTQTLTGNNPNDLLDQRDLLAKELNGIIKVTTRVNRDDQSLSIESGSRLLLGGTSSRQLGISTDDNNVMQVVALDTGESVPLSGGALSALQSLSSDTLPQLAENMDNFAMVLQHQINSVHSTGTNHLSAISDMVSDRVLSEAMLDLNLDDPDLALANGIAGIPLSQYVNFGGHGVSGSTQGLTINVYDPTTEVAQKFIVHYDPETGINPASRSMNDLVAAINTGQGGGFTVYPPTHAGVTGLQAEMVPVDGGFRLHLQSETGKTIDFSPALDLQPLASAWHSPTMTVNGTDAALANNRLGLRVNGSTLEGYTRDPETGVESIYATAAITPGAVGVAFGSLTIDFAAGAYVDGDLSAVNFSSTGAVSGGVVATQAAVDDAPVTIAGRYTGEHSYDPTRPWQMQVLQAGTVGSDANPPLVQFTWYSGNDEVRVREEVTVALDSQHPAGSQVAIGDGVYATFGSGTLSVSPSGGVDIPVTGVPDSAGILPALGMNSLFTGIDAASFAVNDVVATNPDFLAVGRTRSAGDNSNLLGMAAVRNSSSFGIAGIPLDDFYQSMVSDVAVQVRQVSALSANQTVLQRSLENRRDSISGVNIDEEVGLLIQQQQAYQAAARLVSTARELMRELLEIVV
jgi:flagellar hook-associated protein FlgK